MNTGPSGRYWAQVTARHATDAAGHATRARRWALVAAVAAGVAVGWSFLAPLLLR